MRNTLTAIAVCFVLLLSIGCSQKENISRYQNDLYNFRVDLPADSTQVESRREVLDTHVGKRDVDYFVSYSGDTIFIIGAVLHQREDRSEAVIWTELETTAKEVIKEGELIKLDRYRFNDHPALLLTFTRQERENKLYDKLLLTDIDGVLYQLHVAAYKQELLSSPKAARFLASFKYTGD